VLVSGLTLYGASAADYYLTSTAAYATGSILPPFTRFVFGSWLYLLETATNRVMLTATLPWGNQKPVGALCRLYEVGLANLLGIWR
jgi:hypothetical protein